MSIDNAQLLVCALHAGIPVHVRSLIPLHRIYPPTGAVMADRICMRVFDLWSPGRDALYFHPQRFAELKAALAREAAGVSAPSAAELARWDDDGGAMTTV